MRRTWALLGFVAIGPLLVTQTGAATAAPGSASAAHEYVKAEVVGEWESNWSTNLDEGQEATRKTTLDAAFDFVLGPIAHQPSTWVTLASLDLNLLGLVHSFGQGHQDTLDIRPGSSCSGELTAGPGDFGLVYSGTSDGETLAEVELRPTFESTNYLCAGSTTDVVTLAENSSVPVGVKSITWSPRGRSLDDYVQS